MLKLFHICPIRTFPSWLHSSFAITPVVVESILVSCPDVPGSSCTFLASGLKSEISLGNPGHVSGEMVLQDNLLGTRGTHCY